MNEQTKHTQGPWHWEVEDGSMASLYGTHSHVLSMSPCKACFDRVKKEQISSPMGICTVVNEVDSYLIAAAPELLEALEVLLNHTVELINMELSQPHITEMDHRIVYLRTQVSVVESLIRKAKTGK